MPDPRIAAQLRDRFPHPYSIADATAFIDLILTKDPLACFAIVVGSRCIGGIGLDRQHDVHRLSAELGYWLGCEYWGRGIATQAMLEGTLRRSAIKAGIIRDQRMYARLR
jgi:RimJ/RimL family protein N-acetyltransferase